MTDTADIAAKAEDHKMMLLEMATEIVSAHVSNNSVAHGDLPGLISTVYGALAQLGGAPVVAADGPNRPRPEPAVPINRSVKPDYIVCLEDGAKKLMLKRYLKSHYNMTPEQYRERWGLPADYPMVAPNYSNMRSDLAKKNGLGTGRRKR